MKILLAGDFCPTECTDELFKAKDIKNLFADAVFLFEGTERDNKNIGSLS